MSFYMIVVLFLHLLPISYLQCKLIFFFALGYCMDPSNLALEAPPLIASGVGGQ